MNLMLRPWVEIIRVWCAGQVVVLEDEVIRSGAQGTFDKEQQKRHTRLQRSGSYMISIQSRPGEVIR
jgi:hypothetical protein